MLHVDLICTNQITHFDLRVKIMMMCLDHLRTTLDEHKNEKHAKMFSLIWHLKMSKSKVQNKRPIEKVQENFYNEAITKPALKLVFKVLNLHCELKVKRHAIQ